MTFDAEVKTLLAELLASKLELWNLSCSVSSSRLVSNSVINGNCAMEGVYVKPTWNEEWLGSVKCSHMFAYFQT